MGMEPRTIGDSRGELFGAMRAVCTSLRKYEYEAQSTRYHVAQCHLVDLILDRRCLVTDLYYVTMIFFWLFTDYPTFDFIRRFWSMSPSAAVNISSLRREIRTDKVLH